MLPLALAFGLAASPGSSEAESPATFEVSHYVAGPDCPAQPTFEAAVVARAPHARRASPGALPDVRFELLLDTDSAAPRKLRVTLPDDTSEEREITADGCAEAMQSMALIAATILEARAPSEKKSAAEASAPEPPPAPKKAESARPVVSTEPPRRVVTPAHPWLRFGLGGVAEGGAAPTPAFGGSLWAELGANAASALAPALRASAVLARAATVDTEAGSARFSLLLGRVHLCGLRAGRGRWELRGCGVVEAGALLGEGLNTRRSRSPVMPWLGAGLGIIAATHITEKLALDLGASARGLAVHDEFAFSPRLPAHQVPVITWNFQAGVSYRAW